MTNLLYKLTTPPNSVAKSIATDLIYRMYYGKTVIIVDNPKIFIGVLRKQWLKLLRATQIERARTLDPTKIAELSGTANYMQELRFTTRYPLGDYPGDVYVIDLATALQWPPDCSTLYIGTPIEKREQYLLSAWMPRDGLVVLYGQPKD